MAADLPRRSGTAQLNHLVGRLAVHAVELDFDYLFARRRAKAIDWRQASEPDASTKRLTVALSTTWPMLRLSDEALERVRPTRAAAGTTTNGVSPPAPVSAPAATNGNGSANNHHVVIHPPAPPQPSATPQPSAPPVTTAGGSTNGKSTATSGLYAPASQLSTALAPLDDEAAAVVEGFLGTMEHFLIANEEVMSAYLEGSTELAGQPATQRPLVGRIVSWEPEIELMAQRVVNPLEDLYLLDHTLGREVSRTDPDLHALPLMPLAMSIEILAEAASCLLPQLILTGLRDLRAHRWLAFDDAPQTLQVSARRLAAKDGCEQVRVELRIVDDEGPGAPVVEATAVLTHAFSPAPEPAVVALHDGRPSRWQPGELYEQAMFHQPLWQGVRSMDRVGAAGAHAQLAVLPRTGLLRDDPEPNFVLDPVALDSAGQVVGFWAADMLERGQVVFPFRLAALDLYRPTPPVGEKLTCVAAVSLEGEHLVSSDIDVLDADGRCWMRLTGWEDKRFAVPERFAPLARPAKLAPLSSRWETPQAPYPQQTVVCRCMDSRLPLDRALWKPVWASRVLGRHEREIFTALELPETRELEWLAARTAGKECVAELVRATHGLELLHAEIEILPDEQGVPIVFCPALDGLGEAPAISLTHTSGQAAALAAFAPPDGGVGIDIEQLQPRAQGFAQAAFNAAEQELLEQFSPTATEEWLLRIWCAREAAGKALGTGLSGGATAPRVSAIDVEHETLLVDVSHRQLIVWTHCDGELVVATAVDPGLVTAQATR